MSSPVERLEAWCDQDGQRLSGELGAFSEDQLRRDFPNKTVVRKLTAYRTLISYYRSDHADFEGAYRRGDPVDIAYWQGRASATLEAIAVLADAVSPEEEGSATPESDPYAEFAPPLKEQSDEPEWQTS